MGQVELLSAGGSRDGYLTYPPPTTNVARLNVDLSTRMEVIGGTCFQCVFIMIGGSVVSENGCITLVGELPTFILNCSVSFGEQYTMYTLVSVGFIHVPQIFHYHGACKAANPLCSAACGSWLSSYQVRNNVLQI